MTRPFTDVVVVLPGITGSALHRHGTPVWDPSVGGIVQALRGFGRNIQELRLDDDPAEVDDLGDGVTAARIIADVHLIPGLWKIDGYGGLLRNLPQRFSLTPGENLFTFPYDWRRDNRVAARRLERSATGWLHRWRESSGKGDAKLVLLAHSMGGLVARYYVEVLGGWHDTRMLVTFGTPHRGSLDALGFLANGLRKAFGLVDLTELLRSFTSVYQLLPIYPSYDPGDGSLARVKDVDIVGVDRARAADADAFHREIERAVQGNRADPGWQASDYSMHPVVGILQRTSQSARAASSGIELLPSRDGVDVGGDGTVPRVSATPIELSDHRIEVFAGARHADLQNTRSLLQHLEGVLTDVSADIRLSEYRAPGQLALSVSLEDAYLPEEEVTVGVKATALRFDGGADGQGVWHDLRAIVTDASTGAEVARATVPDDEDENGWRTLAVPPLPAGTYRLEVASPEDDVEPVLDVFAVLDPA